MTRKISNPGLHAAEAVRARLGHTAKARREAVSAARDELPSYTDADVEEITGKFEALTETAASAAANAAASATANALTQRGKETPAKPGDVLAQVDASGAHVKQIIADIAKVTAAVASIGSTLAAFAHWVLGWF